MKSFREHLLESLMNKYDSAQLYKLATGESDPKSFAINSAISVEIAEEIKKIFSSKSILIYDQLILENTYHEEIKKLFEKSDDLIKLGVRYGGDLGLTPEEKKKRDEAKNAMANEGEEDGSSQKLTKSNEPIDDTKIIERICVDLAHIDPKSIVEFFWKKSNDICFLYIITENTPDVKNLIKKIQ